MNVVILNHSDQKGGASVVTVRLLQALNTLGVHARMLVVHNSLPNMRIEALKPAWKVQANFLAEHAQIYLSNGLSKKNLFKISTGSWGMPVHQHPWVKDADLVVLAWINQGMVSLKEIAKIQVPVVWIMHDMWCMTGVCHHAALCENYQNECGDCPLLRFPKPKDLSHKVWQNKEKIYNQKHITFVAVSNWLRKLTAHSKLLRRADVRMIHNPFPTEQFSLAAKFTKLSYGVPTDRQLIVMGAARLDDPIKGLDLAIQALNTLDANRTAAVFFGELRDQTILQSLLIPFVWLGPVSDHEVLRDIYALSDVVLSSSHYETLPTTLIEGMASGCVPVSFDQGGQADIIDHKRNGYLAQHPDVEDLAAGLKWALGGPISSEELRRDIEARFSALSVAKHYVQLFEELTK